MYNQCFQYSLPLGGGTTRNLVVGDKVEITVGDRDTVEVPVVENRFFYELEAPDYLGKRDGDDASQIKYVLKDGNGNTLDEDAHNVRQNRFNQRNLKVKLNETSQNQVAGSLQIDAWDESISNATVHGWHYRDGVLVEKASQQLATHVMVWNKDVAFILNFNHPLDDQSELVVFIDGTHYQGGVGNVRSTSVALSNLDLPNLPGTPGEGAPEDDTPGEGTPGEGTPEADTTEAAEEDTTDTSVDTSGIEAEASDGDVKEASKGSTFQQEV